jgi:hypothetical protein
MTLWRVRATLDDRPGFLAVLTASLALRSVSRRPVPPAGPRLGADRRTMLLPDPAGGTYLVERAEPAFTPAEYARAQALAAFAAAVTETARQV